MKEIINRIFLHRSIYTKLFFLFFIIGVIPLILGSLYTYYSSRDAFLKTALKNQELVANSGIRNIVILFVESGANLRLSAQNTAFTHYFEVPGEKSTHRKEQENTLLQILSLFDEMRESAAFADVNGNIISAVFSGKSVSMRDRYRGVSDRPFFRQALNLQKEEIYYAPPEFSQVSQKWVIPVATPIFNQKGILYGVLYIQIYIDSITQLIKGIANPDDIVFVVDQDGRLIAHTERNVAGIIPMATQPDDHPSYRSVVERMATGDAGSIKIFYNGKPSYITYKDIPEERDNHNKWSIGVITSEDVIYEGGSARKYLVFVLSASAALFAIAGILGWRLASPIQKLTATSVAMSKGNLKSRVSIKRGDEIGQLARAFNEMATSIQASHEELLRLSTIDWLTGLYNHREFQKRLEEEIRRASRYGSVLSLLIIDIDNFKKFNDTYGHPAGDVVLQSIGTAILREIRSPDFAARYGGEEMAIILPETASAEALIFSDRLRENIQQLPITVLDNETVHVTVSIGIASFPEDAPDRKGLIDTADQALYFAKEKGRNKAIPYGDTLKAILERKHVRAETLLKQAEEWIFKDISTSIEANFPFFKGHFTAVTSTALQLAEMLHLSEEEMKDLRIAGMLYEIGTLNIPSHILFKQGPLNKEEWEVIKIHPEVGVKLLSNVLKVQNVLPTILHHHERYDGTGYPSSLKGEEIPILARIISVVDAYHTMTSVTPYHRKLSEDEAIDELRRNAGTQFDPSIVEMFIKILKSKEPSRGEKPPPVSATKE